MIRVNDRWDVEWHPGMTVGDLLIACRFTHHYVTVSVNGVLLSPDTCAAHPLADGDDVRVIHIIGGG